MRQNVQELQRPALRPDAGLKWTWRAPPHGCSLGFLRFLGFGGFRVWGLGFREFMGFRGLGFRV